MRYPERATEQRLRRMIVLIGLLYTVTWLVWQWDVIGQNFRLLRTSAGWPVAGPLNVASVLGIAIGSLGAAVMGRIYGCRFGRLTPLVDRLVPRTRDARLRLERLAWVPVDAVLVIMPLLVIYFFTILPSVQAGTPVTPDEMRLAYSGNLSLLVTVILAGARLSIPGAFYYLLGINTARLVASLALSPEVWRDSLLITAQSLVYAGLLASVSVNSLRSSQRMDQQYASTTREMLDATEETVRLAEEARADALVHEKVLASLLITSQAPDAERWEMARLQAVDALEALDEIGSPERTATEVAPRTGPTVREDVVNALGGELDPQLVRENRRVTAVAGTVIITAQLAILVLTWHLFEYPLLSFLAYLPGAAVIIKYAGTEPYGAHRSPWFTGDFLVVALAAPTCLAIGLFTVAEPAVFVAAVESWQVTAVLVSVMVLGMMRSSRLAWLCAGLGAAVLALWGATSGVDTHLFPGGWPVLALGIGTTELFTRWSRRQVERSAQINDRTRQVLLAEARQRIALESRREHSRYVADIVRPFLEQQVSGFPFTPATSARAARLEGRLRDDLRARCFRGTDIARAATDARARGVAVDLLDDGGLDDAPRALHERVVATALRSLDAAVDGAIVVRVLPPGRETVATVVASPPDEEPRRTEILGDGTVVYDGIAVRATRGWEVAR